MTPNELGTAIHRSLTPVITCKRCHTEYDLPAWQALPLDGYWEPGIHPTEERLEQRTCPCGCTYTLPVAPERCPSLSKASVLDGEPLQCELSTGHEGWHKHRDREWLWFGPDPDPGPFAR